MIRAFISSPYRSHVLWDDLGPMAPIRDAMLALHRLSHRLRPVLAVREVAQCPVDAAWSPLVEGDILRAYGPLKSEGEALAWCLRQLDSGIFTHLICCSDNTIPRKPGYGANGCDKEMERARELGMIVTTETDFLYE